MIFNKPIEQTQSTSSHNETPNSPRYTPFYLTLLILSTIGTVLSLPELWAVRESISQLTANPINAIANLASALVILPIAVVALILLWRKDSFGIWLKLSTYAATIVVTVANLLVAEQTLKSVLAQAITDDAKQGTSALGSHLITTIITSTYYTGLIVAIVASVVFGILWWLAWKKQITADNN
jgi:hypothetical protein